ncbi:DUF6680 family protein [Ottowia thiooxydans]|uniref:DUF6680 family protein n=1 Tax=Ottowia thiooxydans TaxID=219182 RepID=UPI000401F8EC|nr:DUF6680 family protein [Ottowia thiooxydans]
MQTLFFGLELKDWATIVAALLGPILAVQAQKAVESLREKKRRKAFLFEQLMATRAARLAPEHVRALNMLDLAFYGERVLGIQHRSTKEQRVLDAWKEYHDHLNNKIDDAQISLWAAQGDELFTNLLYTVAQDLGFKFDRVQLKRGAYSPIAHGEIETEQTELRKAALSLVTGKHALKMNVVAFPVDPEALAANKAAIQNIGKALETGVLQVEVKPQE